ncbi:hypothetical protein J3B02_000144 [Coemansia erecta]|nr:hypothetical protein J3B02_000144 [Coemansia erecta]
MFSDLSQFLPAPKNAAHAKASRSVSKAAEDEDEESGVKDSLSLSAASPMAMTSKPQITLVPHSISKKQRSKIPATLAESVSAKSIKLTGNSPKSTADICDNANAADIAEASNEAGDIDDQKSESTTATKKVHIIDQPFFTINASDQMSGDNPMAKVALAIDNDDGYDDQYQSESNNNNNNQPSTADAGPELHYDPTSGYYYDYVSGTYYYYDPKSQTYIDAKDLLESSSQNRVADVDPSDSDILNLIGRRGVRRGELEAVLNAPVKHVSQSAQLENSGYSDAKAAAEFAAKQWSENKRNKTQTLIDADTIDKKKRQKHNIMYLALQAQEQEETLKETFANRKRSKKEARSKYGY